MSSHKSPAWTRKEGKDPSGGLNAKGRASYKRETGGNLKPPAPNPKTKADAKRRISYCKRSAGQAKMHGIKCSENPKKRICLARKKWKC